MGKRTDMVAAAVCGLMLAGCEVGDPPAGNGLPQACNPSPDMLAVRAWSGKKKLNMAADSGCFLPVAFFSGESLLRGKYGAKHNGFDTVSISVSLAPCQAPVASFSHVVTSAGAFVQGLIGWPVLSRYVWHWDLARQCHYFHESVPAGVQGWDSLRVTEAEVATVRLPGCGDCILDTGAPHGLYLSHEEWERFIKAHPELEVRTYYGSSPAANGAFLRPFVRVPYLELGPLKFRNIRVSESFSPLTGPRLLGREALAQYDIWLDGPARRLYYRHGKGGSL